MQKHAQNKYLRTKNQAKTLLERTVKSFFAGNEKADFLQFVRPTISGVWNASKMNPFATSEK